MYISQKNEFMPLYANFSGILVSVGVSLPAHPSLATCPLSARDVWSRHHIGVHINYLKLENDFLALEKFQRWLCGTHILVQMDSTMVVHYLNRMRGDHLQELGLI